MCLQTEIHEGVESASGVSPDLALSEHSPSFVGDTCDAGSIFRLLSKITYISRPMLESETRWVPLDLDNRQKCLGSRTLPRVLYGETFEVSSGHKASVVEHWQSGDGLSARPAVA